MFSSAEIVVDQSAGRTHELLAACEEKRIRTAEVGVEKPKEQELF